MAFYLSPLVAVNEYDTTTTIAAVSTTVAVAILRNTYKGPELKTQLVTTVDELISYFGQPTSASTCYQDMLTAVGYLTYGQTLYATRALGASATFAEVDVNYTTGTASSGAGSVGITLNEMTTLTADYGGDVDDFGEVSVIGSNLMKIVAKSRGSYGNNIRVAMCGKTTYNTINNLVDSGGISSDSFAIWSTSAALGSIDTSIIDNHSFLVVIQTVPQGYSTIEPSGGPSAGLSNWVTNEYFVVSLDPDAIDDFGRKTYVTKIMNTSNNIRVAFNDGSFTPTTDISSLNTPNWIYLQNGSDSNASDSDIMNALDLYQNPEEIDVNMFIESNKSDTVKDYIVSICEKRKDVMAILDVPMESVLANKGEETTDLKTYVSTTLNINTSYASIYGNWIEVYDKWSGKYRWIPTSGHIAGLFANNDNVAEPWFAPAGPNRAIISGVRRLAFNPNQAQRDILYKNRINPIISLSGMGKLIYGQKTLLDKDSAFNRINVRRLFMVIEKAIATAARYFLFEPNDDVSRLLLLNMIDPYLRDVKSKRGVYDYKIVCDETNNTPERIDNNLLYCDIYIKPTRAAEFIVLNFIATKTGTSFSEIGGVVA